MLKGNLRTKFMLALALISALLTSAMLLMVRQRVQVRVREQLSQELRNSLDTFQALQQQRETTLQGTAALLATLPPLMAAMTSQDTATIQDASKSFWDLSGSQLFVMADMNGQVFALHSTAPGVAGMDAEAPLRGTLSAKRSRDWWFLDGHLFQVFVQPIYFGARTQNAQIGVLAVGFEVDAKVARDVARIASSQVAFRHENDLAVTTIPAAQQRELPGQLGTKGAPVEITLAGEQFLATSVRLSPADAPRVTLTVFKSFDDATRFLQSLNGWILGIGIAGVLAGSVLVYFVSTSFTRPLEQLVKGVQALEAGDFDYPLKVQGNDEVSTLTAAFDGMRSRLQESQQQLLATERLATIGRMATSISHDLRHPLTAILAYAEFLSEARISDAQRNDFYQEIRIAVNRMTEELNSLLGFSKQGEAIRRVNARLEEVIERAIQNVRVLPEFESLTIEYAPEGECSGYFDAGKVERVILNLLFNACEAVVPGTGKIRITSRKVGDNLEVRVEDNGPGIPSVVLENVFQPFVSHGKEQGIGLGLTVVQKIVSDHGGVARVEHTGPTGTAFVITLPAKVPVETV